MIYFISVNYYSSVLISRLLQSMPLSPGACQAVIVNNSPDDVLLHQFESASVTILEAHQNLGFGCGCNLALRWIYERDSNALIWIINPDAYLLKDPCETLHHLLKEYPNLSIIGTIIKTFDGNVWFAGGKLVPETGCISVEQQLDVRPQPYRASDWVSGCSLILNFKCFPECPQFNPHYFLYYEDVEFCRRYANLGHVIAMTQQISIFHEPSSITNRNLFLKLRHSTYSYLLTLEKFVSKRAFLMRFLRLILNAFFLAFRQPNVSFGKLWGILIYLKHRLGGVGAIAPMPPRIAVRPKIHAE